MDREAVASTVLKSVGYDPDTRTLEIEFPSGRVYRYLEVPAEVHAWLMRSPGKGSLFRRMIDGKYTFERVDHLDPNAPSLMDALRASVAQSRADDEIE